MRKQLVEGKIEPAPPCTTGLNYMPFAYRNKHTMSEADFRLKISKKNDIF